MFGRPSPPAAIAMARSAQTSFVRAVKRAFAHALLVQMRQTKLKRIEVAAAGKVSRSYLQSLLKGERQASIGMLISLAEGMNLSPLALLETTLVNLDRIRKAEAAAAETTTPELP